MKLLVVQNVLLFLETLSSLKLNVPPICAWDGNVHAVKERILLVEKDRVRLISPEM